MLLNAIYETIAFLSVDFIYMSFILRYSIKKAINDRRAVHDNGAWHGPGVVIVCFTLLGFMDGG
jgi:hypothetical protein